MIRPYDIADLMRKYISDGFTFESLSNITDASIEGLKRLYYDKPLSEEDKKDIDCASLFLMFLYMEPIGYDGYLESITELICVKFKLSQKAIAKYLGLDEVQFRCFIKEPEKLENGYQLTLRLLHLYTVFFRDTKYYYEGYNE